MHPMFARSCSSLLQLIKVLCWRGLHVRLSIGFSQLHLYREFLKKTRISQRREDFHRDEKFCCVFRRKKMMILSFSTQTKIKMAIYKRTVWLRWNTHSKGFRHRNYANEKKTSNSFAVTSSGYLDRHDSRNRGQPFAENRKPSPCASERLHWTVWKSNRFSFQETANLRAIQTHNCKYIEKKNMKERKINCSLKKRLKLN